MIYRFCKKKFYFKNPLDFNKGVICSVSSYKNGTYYRKKLK